MPEDETFKVTDRRRRDETGEPAAPAPAPPAASDPSPAAVAPEPAGPGPAAQAGPGLQGLFIMLASSALADLGEAADPETGERAVNLEQAKGAIDLLLLLRAKTEGNRTDQESLLLEEMLYDLELRFVRAAKGAAGG